ncbi:MULTISPECIES: nitroreductase family protein [Brucella/Ochrobactrum group]|uniref:Putative NAD(P)H nitroreductase n=2 Tax=Brucella TaxID=234 RepID=A6X0W4_BRUA4|nr:MULTISPECIES: nitroreductase family protein [Brucella]MCQ9146448.1 nitroreductase [Ochrobactrum sp. BTU2]RNL44300.1 nitroreductase [Ochrobactrum sp. MH181795]ABS14868.1 nitroreductase [Brucella anthropi ATCC 49188]AIK45414.1 nitroreductase family protein [Brucella anthropi]KAB2704315.1 nitroreductase [Brucella lupini]
MAHPIFDFLAQRSSTPISAISGPAPEGEELAALLKVAARVPDHGRLTPWRFILYRGDARLKVGEYLAQRAEEIEGPMPEGRKEKELTRFSRAPLVVGVVSSPVAHERIPEWEQFLSAGAVAMNLCTAANALGYASNWITNWYSDDASARAFLGLAPNERVAGFVHIGTAANKMPERPRADMDKIVTEYSGPWTQA